MVGLATLGTIVGTLATITTLSSTTINVQTLSGSTINAKQANGIVRARTLSGTNIYAGTGLILNDTDGSGCSALHLKNGVVSAQTHACP